MCEKLHNEAHGGWGWRGTAIINCQARRGEVEAAQPTVGAQ